MKITKKIHFFPKRGFTLLEIIIALVLLALTLVGLVNLFLGGKRWVSHRRYQMTGGQLGKVFLDPLQLDVTLKERSTGAQNGWGQVNNCLTNPGGGCPGAQTIDNIAYTPFYAGAAGGIDDVVMPGCAASGSCLRRVRLGVRWTEPSN